MDNFLDTYEVKKATEDVQKLQSELDEIRKELKQKSYEDRELSEKFHRLETQLALQGLKLDTIISKQAQTSRMIQQAIYGAIATGVIGGVIALVWSQIGV